MARSWTVTLAILSRVIVINCAPAFTQQQQQVEQMYFDPDAEIDRAYQDKAAQEAHQTHQQDTSTDDGDDKSKYQVHRVHHKLGHHSTAEQKLQSVLVQSAATDIKLPTNQNLQHQPPLPPSPEPNPPDVPDPPGDVAELDDHVPEEQHVSEQTLPVLEDVDQTSRPSEDDEEIEVKRQDSELVEGLEDPGRSEDTPGEVDPAVEKERGGEENLYATALRLRQHGHGDTSNTANVASISDVYFMAVMAGCAVAGLAGLLMAGLCWYRIHKKVEAASDVEYPAYGVTGPTKEKVGSPGDRKLAQSAQMYHYQHQKQQMIASERLNSDVNHGGSEAESEEENEEGDYTVFECPGLATTGEMEVRNPLFNEQTPVAAPADLDNQTRK